MLCSRCSRPVSEGPMVVVAFRAPAELIERVDAMLGLEDYRDRSALMRALLEKWCDGFEMLR